MTCNQSLRSSEAQTERAASKQPNEDSLAETVLAEDIQTVKDSHCHTESQCTLITQNSQFSKFSAFIAAFLTADQATTLFAALIFYVQSSQRCSQLRLGILVSLPKRQNMAKHG